MLQEQRIGVAWFVLAFWLQSLCGSLSAQEDSTENSAASTASGKVDWSQLPAAEPAGVWLFHGDSLGPWQVANKSYFDKHGPVAWNDGVLSLPAGSPGTGVVADFAVPTNNYEIHFEARRTGGDDFFCGLTFPFNDQHGTLILGGWGGGTVGISNVNGFSAVENASTRNMAFEEGRWYKFRLRVTPVEVTLWVDDKSLFVLDTEEVKFSIWWEQKPMLPLGLASWRTSAEFRQLRLVPIEASPSK
ncbi:MAG: DUF1080 domain-containing protein [Planctomycetaceae bacterium]|nr:DUF1080 domain-containing protein [Planctomycetaceae bacterium]